MICNIIKDTLTKNNHCICISLNTNDKKRIYDYLLKKIKEYSQNFDGDKKRLIDIFSFCLLSSIENFEYFENFKDTLKQRLFTKCLREKLNY